MARNTYPSDISREQFEAIRNLLEQARHKTAPRRNDLYDVFCAIPYLLKSGCTWRTLPGDFPGWTTVRYYFDLWIKIEETGVSLLEVALTKMWLGKSVSAMGAPQRRAFASWTRKA